METFSRKGNTEDLQLQAIEYYNQKEYALAAQTFQKIAQTDQLVDWDFYTGLCHLYQYKNDLAINFFDQVLTSVNKYNIEAHWYISLAYLAKKDFKAAKKHLTLVSSHSPASTAWKVQEAKDLLSAIEEYEHQQ
ncbi:MAG: hypothetical protein AAGD05_19715 [Bacteroidota bacterium]